MVKISLKIETFGKYLHFGQQELLENASKCLCEKSIFFFGFFGLLGYFSFTIYFENRLFSSKNTKFDIFKLSQPLWQQTTRFHDIFAFFGNFLRQYECFGIIMFILSVIWYFRVIIDKLFEIKCWMGL